MYELNKKIRELKPYEPLKGDFKIRLDANESYFEITKNMQEKLFEALSKVKLNRYPDTMATELCTAFSNFYNLNLDNVVAGNGSDELISLLFNGFMLKGDKFACFENDFSMYDFYGYMGECECVLIPKNKDFSIDIDLCIKMCENNSVKLLIFSNPCNPTSLGIDREKVLKIVKSLPNCLVVVDEAYMDFWSESVLEDTADYQNLLVLKTCSKAFGMASLRVGFAVGDKRLVDAVKAFKSPYNLDSFSQESAKVVLEHKEEMKRNIEEIISSTKYFYEKFKQLENEEIKVLETKTNFVVVKTEMAKEIYKYLLENKIAIRCFNDYLRITCGTKEENDETFYYIEKYVKSKV